MKRLPRLLHFSEKGPRWLLFILFPLFLNLLLYGNLLPAPSLAEQTPLFAFDGPSLLRFLLSLLLVSLGVSGAFAVVPAALDRGGPCGLAPLCHLHGRLL